MISLLRNESLFLQDKQGKRKHVYLSFFLSLPSSWFSKNVHFYSQSKYFPCGFITRFKIVIYLLSFQIILMLYWKVVNLIHTLSILLLRHWLIENKLTPNFWSNLMRSPDYHTQISGKYRVSEASSRTTTRAYRTSLQFPWLADSKNHRVGELHSVLQCNF
jgi:hypothetical protein